MHRLIRGLSFAGLAFAGLVGGHALAYHLTIPDAHHRSTLYAQSGHGYMPSAAWVAVVVGLSALAAGIAYGFVARSPLRSGKLRRAACSMAVLQAAAFVLVEVLERLSTQAALDTLSVGLLLAGIAVQIVVAGASALVLVGLRKLGASLRAAAIEPVGSDAAAAPHRPASGGLRDLDLDAHPARAPPVLRAA